jgi:hypothetical protein
MYHDESITHKTIYFPIFSSFSFISIYRVMMFSMYITFINMTLIQFRDDASHLNLRGSETKKTFIR